MPVQKEGPTPPNAGTSQTQSPDWPIGGEKADEHRGVWQAALADLELLTDRLEVIGDWREALVRKIRRAELRFELCGLDAEDQEQLTQEVFAFTSVCRALVDMLRGDQ